MDFLAAHGATEARFAEASGFDNLNTPEDLARAEAALRGPTG
jgi:molybdopterin-guanine dinucleotide biosynthesis protein A